MTASFVPEALYSPMWVQHTAVVSGDTTTTAVSLCHDDYTNGEYVRFDGSGKAQVTKDVGESMIEHYDAVEEVDDGGDDEATASADDGDTIPEFSVGDEDESESDNE